MQLKSLTEDRERNKYMNMAIPPPQHLFMPQQLPQLNPNSNPFMMDMNNNLGGGLYSQQNRNGANNQQGFDPVQMMQLQMMMMNMNNPMAMMGMNNPMAMMGMMG